MKRVIYKEFGNPADVLELASEGTPELVTG